MNHSGSFIKHTHLLWSWEKQSNHSPCLNRLLLAFRRPLAVAAAVHVDVDSMILGFCRLISSNKFVKWIMNVQLSKRTNHNNSGVCSISRPCCIWSHEVLQPCYFVYHSSYQLLGWKYDAYTKKKCHTMLPWDLKHAVSFFISLVPVPPTWIPKVLDAWRKMINLTFSKSLQAGAWISDVCHINVNIERFPNWTRSWYAWFGM